MNGGSWSWLLADTAIKTSVLPLSAGAFVLLLRRSSAAMRHLVWTAAVAALLMAPPLSRVVPDWHVPVTKAGGPGPVLTFAPSIPRPAATSQAPISPPPRDFALPRQPVDYGAWAVFFWALGAAVLAIFFGGGAVHLARVARGASAIDDERIAGLAETAAQDLGVPRGRFRLRWSDRALTPMTWGLKRPVLLLPTAAAKWSDGRLRQVLIHEIAHVKRWDVATQAVSSLACVLYWFNPLVWWAARRMLVERERACDDLVLGSGAKPSDYAHGLLDIARSLGADWTTSRVSPAMARRSQISGRLLAVLDPEQRRQQARKPAVVAGMAVALALMVPAASLSFSPLARPVARFDLQDAQKAVLAAEASWRAAFRSRDASAIGRFYTSDALVVIPHLYPARGRRGASDVVQYLLDQGVVDVDIQPVEMYAVGEMICEAGRATFWRAGGGVHGNLRFMTLWKKEDGEWRIHRDFGAPQGDQR